MSGSSATVSKPKLRSWLHGLGGLLCLAGVWFVGTRLQTEVRGVEWTRLTSTAWMTLSLLAVLYGLANIMLVRAWWRLLQFVSLKVEFAWALRVYGLSQLGKYVPGNIFHFAGRQALGMAAGLPGAALAKSSLWELALIAAAGSLYSAWCLPLLPLPVELSNFVAGMMFGVGVLLSGLMLQRWISRDVAAAMLWQLAFLALSGSIFGIGLYTVQSGPVESSLWPLVAGCYVVAWLIGLVTPGAPAGVGVREAVLLLLLGAWIAPADLVLAVVLGRCVTVVGDLLFFVAAGAAGFLGVADDPAIDQGIE